VLAEHEVWNVLVHDESPVGKLAELGSVVELFPGAWSNPLAMKLRVDRVGPDLIGMELTPEGREAVVVGAPTQRAWAMSRCERRRLVEEEELGETTRLKKWTSLPAPELEPTGDPALSGEAPPNASGRVVEAAAVSVHEAAGRIRDELAERRDPVLHRHLGVYRTRTARHGRSRPPRRVRQATSQEPKPDER